MFTGLIEDLGAIRSTRATRTGRTFEIASRWPAAELTIGESIAVDGACLTVTTATGDAFTVEASQETLNRTTLGALKTGDRVHLERALRLADRLGGHLVLGHVDGVGKLVTRREVGEALSLQFEAPAAVMDFIIEKGSITIDGVSLTVNGHQQQRFDVTIIPHTTAVTKLAAYRPGARVNLEADVVGKYVKKFVTGDASIVTPELLQRWSTR